jgi:hypothetical protein
LVWSNAARQANFDACTFDCDTNKPVGISRASDLETQQTLEIQALTISGRAITAPNFFNKLQIYKTTSAP